MLQSYQRFKCEVINVRIAEVCYLAPPAVGGVEKHVFDLSSALLRRGYEVEIHTSNFFDLRGSPLPKGHMLNIPTYRYSSKFVKKTTLFSQPIHFPTLLLGLVKRRPDVVHVHSMASQHLELCYLYARLTNKPLLVTGHYSAADLYRLYTKRKNGKKTKRLIYWEKRMPKIMEYATLIALTETEKKAYQELFGFKNIVVIPNGLDLSEFKPQATKENYLLYVGRVVPEKRLDFLLKAHRSIKEEIPLIIAGYAPDKNYLLSLKDISHNGVSFVSPDRSGIIDLLSRAKALILPSKNEAFGIVLLEAMASGVPVIASNSGGFPEVLANGKYGLLFDPDDPANLLEQIRLLDDPKIWNSLSNSGLERANDYSWDRLALIVEEVFLKVEK